MSAQKETFLDHGIIIPYYKLSQYGQIKVNCPECSSNGSGKSLSVNISEGVWQCHRCSFKGCLKSNVKNYEARVNQPHKGEYMRTNSTNNTDNVKPFTKTKFRVPNYVDEGLPEVALEWFKSRGISEATVKSKRIGYKTWNRKDGTQIGLIQFPYYKGNEVINVKFRHLHEKKFIMSEAAELSLYGLSEVAFSSTEPKVIYWVEGEMDVLSMLEAGYTNVLSLPNGAPQPNESSCDIRFRVLDSAWDIISQAELHIICPDADAPGARYATELKRRLGVEKCLIARWENGFKDPNEILMAEGVEGLRAAVEAAQPFPIEGEVTVRSLYEEMDLLYTGGLQPGASPGWECLRPFYTVPPGYFSVFTGVPGSGKTNFLDALTVNLATSNDWRFAFFSPEIPSARHAVQLLMKYVGIRYTDIPEEELQCYKEWVNDHYSFIVPPPVRGRGLQSILEVARELVHRRGINGLIIDPWNRLEHDKESSTGDVEHLARSLDTIARFSQDNSIHSWLVAHPKVMQTNKDGEIISIPGRYSISGGAQFDNIADFYLTVDREISFNGTGYTGVTDIMVWKVRMAEHGEPGRTKLRFDKASGRYYQDDTVWNAIPVSNEAANQRGRQNRRASQDEFSF